MYVSTCFWRFRPDMMFPKQGEGAKNKTKRSKKARARGGAGLLQDLDAEELNEVDRCALLYPSCVCF